MLNKLSFNIFNELNESESKAYEIKKKVFMENNGVKVKNLTENLKLVKITFECPECGYSWTEDFKDYFEDEDDLNEVFEYSDTECPECGGNCQGESYEIIEESEDKTSKEDRIASLRMQLEKDADQLADDEKEAIEKEIADLEKEVYNESEEPKKKCPKCDKEVCECDKSLTEEIEATEENASRMLEKLFDWYKEYSSPYQFSSDFVNVVSDYDAFKNFAVMATENENIVNEAPDDILTEVIEEYENTVGMGAFFDEVVSVINFDKLTDWYDMSFDGEDLDESLIESLNKGEVYENPNGVKVKILDVDNEHLVDGEAQVTYRFLDTNETKCVKASGISNMLKDNRYKLIESEEKTPKEEIEDTLQRSYDRKYKEGLEENENDPEFNKQLLGRLISDCKYFLGNGNRAEKHLWAGNVKDQIAKIRELANKLGDEAQISSEEIDELENEMTSTNEGCDNKPLKEEAGDSIFKLKINTSGEAFEGNPETEVARILNKLAGNLEYTDEKSILDMNGNVVGNYGFAFEGVTEGCDNKSLKEEDSVSEEDIKTAYRYIAKHYADAFGNDTQNAIESVLDNLLVFKGQSVIDAIDNLAAEIEERMEYEDIDENIENKPLKEGTLDINAGTTLGELLDRIGSNEFGTDTAEIMAANGDETEFITYVHVPTTEEGKQRFADVLNSKVTHADMSNGIIYIDVDASADKINEFLNASNGNISEEEFDKLFILESALTEAEELGVTNLQVIKEQGNIYMLQSDNQYIVGENYNESESTVDNAEIYENKEEADKDYLDRCDIIGGEKTHTITTDEMPSHNHMSGTEKVEEGIIDDLRLKHRVNKAEKADLKSRENPTKRNNKKMANAYAKLDKEKNRQIDKLNDKKKAQAKKINSKIDKIRKA